LKQEDAYKLIKVRYWNDREGRVDDVTLNELIITNRVKQFYRPSENRWANIEVDPVRRGEGNYRGPERRGPHAKRRTRQKEKPRGLLARLFNRREKSSTKRELSAQEWFYRGFELFHSAGDYQGAIQAFAASLELDPTYARAFLNRGMAYGVIGNVQQAIEDYSRAIALTPGDAKLYYVRGLAFKRLGMVVEAITDLKRAADLQYRPAGDLLKSEGIFLVNQSQRVGFHLNARYN
jgi:tetratricopeptide (TPR) repeat protein